MLMNFQAQITAEDDLPILRIFWSMWRPTPILLRQIPELCPCLTSPPQLLWLSKLQQQVSVQPHHPCQPCHLPVRGFIPMDVLRRRPNRPLHLRLHLCPLHWLPWPPILTPPFILPSLPDLHYSSRGHAIAGAASRTKGGCCYVCKTEIEHFWWKTWKWSYRLT